jgi:hypothetical protein
MAFLIVGGVEVAVQTAGSPGRRVAHRAGAEDRSFSGRLLSTRRGRKDEWSFTTEPLDAASLDVVDAMDDTFQPCGGTALGREVVCRIAVTGADYIPDGAGHRATATLTLTEA